MAKAPAPKVEVPKAELGNGDRKLPPPPPPAKSGRGLMVAVVILTLLAGVTGGGVGVLVASHVKEVMAEQARADGSPPSPPPRYSGDMVLEGLKPVVVNLSSPANTWVRIEGSIIFKNGALQNPQVAASQIREDILTYVRTLTLTQLEGPSALQNLREDLNERAKLRVEGKLSELVIETLVVQ